MMYTCGYWPEGTASLEEAQVNKIEHVCRKVRLREAKPSSTSGADSAASCFTRAALRRQMTGTNTTTEQVDAVAEIDATGLQASST